MEPALPSLRDSEKLPLENIFTSQGRTRILKMLATEGELNISALARRSGLGHYSTYSFLQFLVDAEILQLKRFGRVRIYRLRIEDRKIHAIKDLFDIWEAKELGGEIRGQ